MIIYATPANDDIKHLEASIGAEIISCITSQALLLTAEKLAPEVMVVDDNLTTDNENDFFNTLRLKSSSSHILLLVDQDKTHDLAQVIAGGSIDDFLFKPFDLEDLATRIKIVKKRDRKPIFGINVSSSEEQDRQQDYSASDLESDVKAYYTDDILSGKEEVSGNNELSTGHFAEDKVTVNFRVPEENIVSSVDDENLTNHDFDLFTDLLPEAASIDFEQIIPESDTTFASTDKETVGLEALPYYEGTNKGEERVTGERPYRVYDNIVEPKEDLSAEGIDAHSLVSDVSPTAPGINSVDRYSEQEASSAEVFDQLFENEQKSNYTDREKDEAALDSQTEELSVETVALSDKYDGEAVSRVTPAKKIMKFASNAVFVVLMLLIVTLSYFLIQSRLSGGPLQVAGYQMYVVLSGSMNPTFNTGSVIFVREVTPAQLAAGDIITFQSQAGSESLTTHRIVEVNTGEALQFVTRGDANSVNDPNPVPAENIIGRVTGSIPLVGYLLSFVQTRQGLILFIFVPGAFIVLLEIIKIVKNLANKKAEIQARG